MPKTPMRGKKKVPAHKHPHYQRRLLLWLLLFLCAVLLLVTLYSSNNTGIPQPASQSSKVTYQGVTPCADCTGIKTTLTLNSNPNTYTLNLVYQGKNTSFTETGTWSLSNSLKKEIYTLIPSNPKSSKTQYQVLNSTQVRQLDGEGNALPESIPFTLKKE